MTKFKKSYYEMIQKASIDFYEVEQLEEIEYTDNQNKSRKKTKKTEKKVDLNTVASYQFNPAELQFPSGHGRWVNSYFFRFWEVILKDAGMFFLKLLDRYVHEQEKDHLFPTLPTICEDFDLTEYNVRKNLDVLEKYNFIKRYRVYDTQSRVNLPSLIKIRKDIPLLPEHVISGLSDKLQREHTKYLQDISKPLNLLLGDKTEEIEEKTTPSSEDNPETRGGLNFTPPPNEDNDSKIAGKTTNTPGLNFKPPSFEIQTRGGLKFKGRSIDQYRSISQKKYKQQQPAAPGGGCDTTLEADNDVNHFIAQIALTLNKLAPAHNLDAQQIKELLKIAEYDLVRFENAIKKCTELEPESVRDWMGLIKHAIQKKMKPTEGKALKKKNQLNKSISKTWSSDKTGKYKDIYMG